jgi:hypothetical protein
MRGLIARLLPVVAALLVASGCSNNDATTTPASSTASSTDTFTGTLSSGGGFTYPIVVLAAGSISAQITSLVPDSNQVVGIALGTWNGNACQLLLTNDTAVQSSSVSGQATVSGDFCVRVYDAAGTVTTPETYIVQVVHP